MTILEEILQQTKAEPIARINGIDVFDFTEGQKMNKLHLAEEKLTGKSDELGEREVSSDGMHFSNSKTRVKVINPERYFSNRFRVKKNGNKKVLEMVTDYRAIEEQQSGRIYTNVINSYLIGKEGNDMKVVGQDKVSDKVFCNEFTSTLSVQDAVKIFQLIDAQATTDQQESKLSDIFA